VDHLQSFAARARLINMYWGELGDPNYVKQDMARYEQATADGVLAQAQKTINLNARVVLRVIPAQAAAAPSGAKPAAVKKP
jgi:hypothetical protein